MSSRETSFSATSSTLGFSKRYHRNLKHEPLPLLKVKIQHKCTYVCTVVNKKVGYLGIDALTRLIAVTLYYPVHMVRTHFFLFIITIYLKNTNSRAAVRKKIITIYFCSQWRTYICIASVCFTPGSECHLAKIDFKVSYVLILHKRICKPTETPLIVWL